MPQWDSMKAMIASRHETDYEQALRLSMLADAEREEAYRAVALAMANYRWWGWSNISQRFRMWVTGMKLRLGWKLWP